MLVLGKKKRIVLAVLLLLFILSALLITSLKKQKDYRNVILSLLESANTELKFGEYREIVIENKFGADTCVMCGGYSHWEYIYPKVKDIGISKSVVKKIARKIASHDGYYLFLVKGNNILFYINLGEATTEVLNSETAYKDGEDVLATKLSKSEIRIKLKKIDYYRPLLIESIN